MKITPEDMDAVRKVFNHASNEFYLSGGDQSAHDNRDIDLARILARIYDRGYKQALKDREAVERGYSGGTCPYTFAHTRHWCGYAGCREG